MDLEETWNEVRKCSNDKNGYAMWSFLNTGPEQTEQHE